MKNKSTIFIVACSLVAASAANAQQQVFKSIDAEGKVTYSSTPPTEGTTAVVEEVPIAPPPSEAQQQEAEERARSLDKEKERSEQQRAAEKEKKSADVAAAEKDLADAQAALEKTKVKTQGDWQTIAAGGRVLKQSYLDRVEQAEERVKAAKAALKKARRGR